MGKIFNGLTKEIMTSVKSGEKEKANALKNLKAKLLEYKTSVEGAKIVNANNGEIPDANEITVIKKYVKELQGDIDTYKTAKPEMAKAAEVEKSYLEVYLPKEASEADVRTAVEKYVADNGDIEQKQMGIVIKTIKAQFDNVDGGMLAKIVKSYIK